MKGLVWLVSWMSGPCVDRGGRGAAAGVQMGGVERPRGAGVGGYLSLSAAHALSAVGVHTLRADIGVSSNRWGENSSENGLVTQSCPSTAVPPPCRGLVTFIWLFGVSNEAHGACLVRFSSGVRHTGNLLLTITCPYLCKVS